MPMPLRFKAIFHCLFSTRFSVPCFVLRTLIHLDFSFMQGDTFSQGVFLTSLSKIQGPHVLGFNSWSKIRFYKLTCLVLCQYHCEFYCCSSVVQLEIRWCFQDFFKASGLLKLSCFSPYEGQNFPFMECKEFCWNFDGCCIGSLDCFG